MRIALDPYMFRRVPLTDLPRLVADLDYQYVGLSPREDFLPFLLYPRADKAQSPRSGRRWPRPTWRSPRYRPSTAGRVQTRASVRPLCATASGNREHRDRMRLRLGGAGPRVVCS